jgi:hypothetical protein
VFEAKRVDGRRNIVKRDWARWLIEADRWYTRYLRTGHDSPFAYHEVASVGFLSCAASRANFLTLNEYELEKKRGWGRADLWMLHRGISYSFEFKRAWHAATAQNLITTLREARRDIGRIPDDECHHAAGGVIAYVDHKKRVPTLEEFCGHKEVDMAYRIGPAGKNAVFLFFAFKER